jgi:hypothetical protein
LHALDVTDRHFGWLDLLPFFSDKKSTLTTWRGQDFLYIKMGAAAELLLIQKSRSE